MPLDNLKLISAGAGSGKTYRLTEELTQLLQSGSVRPTGVIATTFTKRAAAELRERVRVKLLREGLGHEANELKNALIGTVHGLGVKLLKRFAFEAGVSPQVDIIADQDHQRLFNLSMASAIAVDDIEDMEALCERLSLSRDGELYNWRKDVLRLVEVVRGNAFTSAQIQDSKKRNWEALSEQLPEPATDLTVSQFVNRLKIALTETIAALENNEADGTKTTATYIQKLKGLSNTLKRGHTLPWADICGLANPKVAVKSKALVAPIKELGELHASLPAFQHDLRTYLAYIYDFADQAIREYDTYKKARGRIDYTDMEVLVLDLLGDEHVRTTLSEELDLLIVDEFQDTSPIQLAIFLQLSQLAKRSIWVGDPKQSIYGFRGAEPRLMRAVMDANGPIKPENIQTHSWRSREDIVRACNAIFTKGFPEMSEEAVALSPVRTRAGGGRFNRPAESAELAEKSGIVHWVFNLEAKARYAAAWHYDMTAKAIAEMLAAPPLIGPKDGPERRMLPMDVAVLCRTNKECENFARALAKQGLPAAIARTGLLATAEATLVLACMKYLLDRHDSLSIAEILLFGSRKSLASIVEHRLDYLAALEDADVENDDWGSEASELQTLNELREVTGQYATSELLNILLERLDVRRTVVAWGDGEQRLSNIDELRRLAVEYEGNCHRLHRAASLPGYLLYLDQLRRERMDKQGAAERPEAVNVLTYHKSKGLEWPAVVTMALDQDLRADVWGLSVVPLREVDLNEPLAGRWIKYWVNPYGKLSKDIPLLEALKESRWQTQATEDARGEEARLLYVGMTRARDYLILPTAKKGAGWLDRVFERGGGLTPVLDPASTDAPFDWKGNEVHKALKTWTEPRNISSKDLTPSPTSFLRTSEPSQDQHVPLGPDPAWSAARYATSTLRAIHFYHDCPEPDPEVNERMYSRAVGAFLISDHPSLPAGLRDERARQLLANYLPTNDVLARPVLQQADSFTAWLDFFGARTQVQRREQLMSKLGNRAVAMEVDYLITTEGGLVVIQDVHLSPKLIEQEGPKYATDLALLKELVAKSYGVSPKAVFLHLPGAGAVFELA